MANEFKHKDPGSELTQAEFIAACGDGHIFACQATGDILYASSATVLKNLGKGAAGTILNMGGSCIPAWTASPSVTDLTISGGCITLTGAATDIDLIDNNASALSFDASGKAGIIDIVTTNCSEGVTMSGTLGVTGALTATAGFTSAAASTITIDADSEFIGLKLTNQSDSANTCGFVSLAFDLEDTGGNAVDSAKISVKKEASFTATASTQDSSIEFHTSLNGTLAEKMTINSAGNVCIGGDLTVTGGCITLAGSLIFSGGDTTSLNLIDAIDATTEATIETAIDTLSNLTTTGALNAGSITSGFGTIDTGSSNITTTGLISGGSLDIDNVLINGTTIGHTCDTDLMTIGDAALTIKGDITVGVDDTGHDVKFFGAAAGAFMLYDQSCDLLEIRGATAAGPGLLRLSTGEATVVACDVLGKIEFQAPAECGTDAIVAGANIQAVAQATFTASVNNTDLLFMTGLSGAATEKFRFTANGELGVGGANYGTDGQVLTSTGAGTAPAWEAAGAGSNKSAKVTHDAAQSTSTGSEMTVAFNTASVNNDSMADTANRLTFTTAGTYLVQAYVQVEANAAGRRHLALRLNGSGNRLAVTQTAPSISEGWGNQVALLIAVSADDYIEVRFLQTSGSSLDIQASNGSPWLSAVKILG